MSVAPDPLSQAKAALRRAAAAGRERAHASLGTTAGDALVRHGLDRLAALRPRVVAGFQPIRSEIDVRPLMLALAAATGADLAMPVVIARGQALLFRRWQADTALTDGPFGTAHPADSEPVLAPDLVLVPLLAFDRRRHRLGYGAGFYDRTLAGLRAAGTITAVGIAYGTQEVDQVPVGDHDQVLDLVLTERGFI
jgi:5-formyltetrahydrofolate cyclo-ligase